MKTLDHYIVRLKDSIRDALKKMDEGGKDFCVCVDAQSNVVGVITDGDFRRAVHHGIQLDENVSKIINRKFYAVAKGYNREEVAAIFSTTIVRQIPVIEDKMLVDLISRDDFYSGANLEPKRILDLPTIIMAGGKGTRLDPFTRILPKPLIPLGNDPIIKVIMDEFNKFGMNHFYISLHDKGRMVRAYFHEHDLGYHIEYLVEEQPLGTAGALKQLEGKIKQPFFVSNCDVIIRADYGAFYDFHREGGYALSMVGSMRHFTIPYGVCEVNKKGELMAIIEKPQYDFLVNTGMYILEPKVLALIPDQAMFNMTDLILKVQETGNKVGIFPVSEKSWVDIGQLSEYKETAGKLSF